jgi:energy-coupling factor transport system ATP-binding protein
MNEVAKYAEEIIVMNDGNIIEQDTPKELFRQI